MIKLNKLFTESISGQLVLVSYANQPQTFKVVDKESGDVLVEGNEIHVSAFLETNGARMYAPRFMANYPVSKVNQNAADMTHMTPFHLLEFLRERKEDDLTLEMTIYPRDKQMGNKLVEGIKIPFGKCLVEDLSKTSLINLIIEHKEDLKQLKKIAVRTYGKDDIREVALVMESNDYYPMHIEAKDIDSFANSLPIIAQQSEIEIDAKDLTEALTKENSMNILSRCLDEEKVDDTIQESFSVDDLINSHIVVFESADLNSLSRTLFHVHPEAAFRKWKVSEIKESVENKGFFFEVQGNNTDALLSDDLILGRLVCENVYITHRTPLHESSPMEKAVFALMNGLSLEEAVNSLVKEQTAYNIQEKKLEECGLGGCADIAAITPICINAPAPVSAPADGAMTSADIQGLFVNGMGKVLTGVKDIKKSAPKKAKSKDKQLSVLDLDPVKESVLSKAGMLESYKEMITLFEDDFDAPTEDAPAPAEAPASSLSDLLDNMPSGDELSAPSAEPSMPSPMSEPSMDMPMSSEHDPIGAPDLPVGGSDAEAQAEDEDISNADLVAIITKELEDEPNVVNLEAADGTELPAEELINLVPESSVKVKSEENV